MSLVTDFAHWVGMEPSSVVVLLLLVAGLAAATLIGRHIARDDPNRGATELELRIRSWWVIVALVAGALLLGRTAAIVFFAFVSFLALKEYFSIIPTRRADRVVLFWVYLAIPVQYLLIANAAYGFFIILVPVYMFLFLPSAMVVRGETDGFLKAVGTLHWGLMTTVYSLGHIAYLLVLPGADRPGEGIALVLALLILTQGNDVAQYVWGKNFGRRKILPAVSPGKTWEGFLGGLATTVVMAFLILPFLNAGTVMKLDVPWWLYALLIGLAVSIGGFFGDVTESAVKRDLGRKDSGTLIPGHGGILDRVDSLIFTAPLFLHITRYFVPYYWI